MQAVKSKDTAPELFVRRLLHARGYRYRLHKRELPGAPTWFFQAGGRWFLFIIHACFWHATRFFPEQFPGTKHSHMNRIRGERGPFGPRPDLPL
jgi:DNA mismatch endonuclease Vsr